MRSSGQRPGSVVPRSEKAYECRPLVLSLRTAACHQRLMAGQSSPDHADWQLCRGAVMQEKVTAVRRRQMRHVLFTEPEVIEAGTQARVSACWCIDSKGMAGAVTAPMTGSYGDTYVCLSQGNCLVITARTAGAADRAVLQPTRHAARVAGGDLGPRRLQQVAAQVHLRPRQDDAARRRRRALFGERVFLSHLSSPVDGHSGHNTRVCRNVKSCPVREHTICSGAPVCSNCGLHGPRRTHMARCFQRTGVAVPGHMTITHLS